MPLRISKRPNPACADQPRLSVRKLLRQARCDAPMLGHGDRTSEQAIAQRGRLEVEQAISSTGTRHKHESGAHDTTINLEEGRRRTTRVPRSLVELRISMGQTRRDDVDRGRKAADRPPRERPNSHVHRDRPLPQERRCPRDRKIAPARRRCRRWGTARRAASRGPVASRCERNGIPDDAESAPRSVCNEEWLTITPCVDETAGSAAFRIQSGDPTGAGSRRGRGESSATTAPCTAREHHPAAGMMKLPGR